jgi:hypothetical protein
MPRIFVLLFIIYLITPHNNLFAQQELKTVITGQVIDIESGELLEGVNVFLSYTTIGVTTGKDGSFKLMNIPVGVFELVVSHVGYEKEVVDIRVEKTDSLSYEFKLKPKIVLAPEVEISTDSPEEWKENLEKFINAFIVSDKNNNLCKILNPEVINLQLNNDTLNAWSDSVIRVDNRELGYQLNIVLSGFKWNIKMDYGIYLIYPRFEELQPHSQNESKIWKESRKTSYLGSMKHFLRTLLSGTTEEESFRIYAGTFNKILKGQGHYVDAKEIVQEFGGEKPFKKLIFPGFLRIEYGTRFRYQESVIKLTEEEALIDESGNLLNPLAVEVSGAWAKKRIADLMPLY